MYHRGSLDHTSFIVYLYSDHRVFTFTLAHITFSIGLSIFQSSIILFWVSGASKWNATVPIYDKAYPLENTANYINPLPHTLMLTAIVVGVATLGVAFGLFVIVYRRFNSLDEYVIIEKLKSEDN